MWLAIAFTFVFLSYLFNSIFWNVMAGLLMVAAGLEFLDRSSEWTYTIFGTVIIVVGLYLLAMVPVDLISKKRG